MQHSGEFRVEIDYTQAGGVSSHLCHPDTVMLLRGLVSMAPLGPECWMEATLHTVGPLEPPPLSASSIRLCKQDTGG